MTLQTEEKRALAQIQTTLQLILEALLYPERFSTYTNDPEEVKIFRVRVLTVDTPVRGPDEPVAKGYTTAVRQRRHTTGSPTGYVAGSRGNTLDDTRRGALRDGDVVHIKINNLNKVWFNANAANTDFELWIES